MNVSFGKDIEVEVEVEAEVSGCYTPARITADPYYSTPAEGPDIDDVRVYLVGYNGNRLEITDYVDCEQFDDEIVETASERD
jgi:hypothetical protein